MLNVSSIHYFALSFWNLKFSGFHFIPDWEIRFSQTIKKQSICAHKIEIAEYTFLWPQTHTTQIGFSNFNQMHQNKFYPYSVFYKKHKTTEHWLDYLQN